MKSIKVLSQTAIVLTLASTIGMSALSASADSNNITTNTIGDKSDLAVIAKNNAGNQSINNSYEAAQQQITANKTETTYKSDALKGVTVTYRYTQYVYNKSSLTEPKSIILKNKIATVKRFAQYGNKTTVETQYGWSNVSGVKMDITKTNVDDFKHLATNIKQDLPSAKIRATYYTVLPGGKASYKATVKHNIKEYKTVVDKKAVKHLRKGTKVSVKGVTKKGKTYKLVLTNGHVITANKHFVTLHK